MHHLWHKLIASFLIAGVVLSTIPVSSLHSHKQSVSCESHTEEVDLCHLQIYHGYFSSDNTCEHNTHVHSEIKKCDWCKFVKPVRDEYNKLERTKFFECSANIELGNVSPFSYQIVFVLSNQGRAPPVS